jgi:CelD/BcsL family acetyltransferase involved in cellulose biosynthesis
MSATTCLRQGCLPRSAAAGDVIVCRTREAVKALSPEWRQLYRRSGGSNPFVSPEWVSACFESVAADNTPYVVALRSRGALRGVAPLRLESLLGFRVLRPAGSGWSPYAGFLADPDEPDAERALLSALAERRKEWDLLLITQLAEPYSRLHLLSTPSNGVDSIVEPTPWPGSAYLARDMQWDTLLAEGPGWLKRMAKAHRKFEREGGSVVRLSGPDAAARVDAVEAVEAASWQGRRGHTGRLKARKTVVRLLMHALETCPEAELRLAYKDDKPIAYEVNFLPGKRLWLYRGAYDPTYARWSPGGILDFLSIRDAWLSGRREYDFMSGGEAYKLACTDTIRELKQLTLVAQTLRGRLAYGSLLAPKRFAESHPVGKRMVRFAARALRSPRAFLPGSGAAARKAH